MSTLSRVRRLLIAACAALLVFAIPACSGQAQQVGGTDDKHVTIGTVPWAETIATSNLWKELLEQQGYTVDLKNLEVASLYTGVAQGQIDLFTTSTPKVHEDYWARFSDDFVDVGTWYDTLIQGFVVPEYVDAQSITDIQGRATEFDGKIVGIEAGSGLMDDAHEKAAKDYDLTGYDIVDGSTPAMLAALDTAIKAKKPVVVTLWQPHWAFEKYQIRLLEDPAQSFGGNDTYHVVASKKFAENKEAIDQLAAFHMTPEELQSLELEIENAGQGNERQAVKAWIEQNQSVVDKWTHGGV
jgi:glycine betaine/proline transport system substrate-binding protein